MKEIVYILLFLVGIYASISVCTWIYVWIGINRINPTKDVPSSYDNYNLWYSRKKIKDAEEIFETMVKTRDETYRKLKGH